MGKVGMGFEEKLVESFEAQCELIEQEIWRSKYTTWLAALVELDAKKITPEQAWAILSALQLEAWERLRCEQEIRTEVDSLTSRDYQTSRFNAVTL
ncbi:hypothetical protein [Chromobacterium violaceum]|uniref:hypothetical protein n=1 Tax=Chromobacterium violaceum TaxID=536 RepID=UPI0018B08E25|nr:hypothetical protein [Chromobacterium violaceum]